MKKIRELDKKILLLFNEKIRCRFFDYIMPVITHLCSVPSVLIYIVILFSLTGKNLFTLAILSSLMLSAIITWTIKFTVNRTRPFKSIPNLKNLNMIVDRFSFPSAHSSAAFSIATIGILIFPEITLVWIAFAILIGMSRMYVGVHYPLDISIGAIIGTLSSIYIYNIFV